MKFWEVRPRDKEQSLHFGTDSNLDPGVIHFPALRNRAFLDVKYDYSRCCG